MTSNIEQIKNVLAAAETRLAILMESETMAKLLKEETEKTAARQPFVPKGAERDTWEMYLSASRDVRDIKNNLAAAENGQVLTRAHQEYASPIRKIKYAGDAFLADSGKPDKGNQDQHRREEKHFDTYQRAAKAAGKRERREMESAEALQERLDKVHALATEGMKACDSNASKIMIAHKHGWKAANAWSGDSSLDLTEEETAKLKKALKEIGLQGRSGSGGGSRGGRGGSSAGGAGSGRGWRPQGGDRDRGRDRDPYYGGKPGYKQQFARGQFGPKH